MQPIFLIKEKWVGIPVTFPPALCVFCQYFRVTKLISRLGWLHVTLKKMPSEKESFITL